MIRPLFARSIPWLAGDYQRKTLGEAVMKIAAIVGRFPEQELAIRRICSRDPDFLGVCEDYGDAAAALKHWQAAGEAYVGRADEYRNLLGEFEEEILQRLAKKGVPVRSHE